MDSATFEIEAAADNNTNCRRRRPSMALIVCFLTLGYVAIMLIFMKFGIHFGNVQVKTPQVQEFNVGLHILNDSLLIEASSSVDIAGFMRTGNIDPIPELGIFSLTMGVIKHHPLVLLSNTTFNITRDEQLLHVKFGPQRIPLPEKEISLFRQRYLHHAGIWLKLDGEFKWHPKKEPLFVVRDKRMLTHFRCVIYYKRAPFDKIHLKKCIL